MPNEAETEHNTWGGGQEDPVKHHNSSGSCSSDKLICGGHKCNTEGRLFLCPEIYRDFILVRVPDKVIQLLRDTQ